MEEQPLNKSIPLSAMYKSLVKHYAKQNKYIDELEEKINKLNEKLMHKDNALMCLNKKFEKIKNKRQKNLSALQKFMISHKENDVNEENIKELINEIKNIVNEQDI